MVVLLYSVLQHTVNVFGGGGGVPLVLDYYNKYKFTVLNKILKLGFNGLYCKVVRKGKYGTIPLKG